jgi:hypothetical protein
MDRYDERKSDSDTDEVGSSSREGDVLGLGGSAVPKMPEDPSASSDPESVRKRRERARAGEAEDRRDDDPYRQSDGVAGVDMGAGGRGTDISGE